MIQLNDFVCRFSVGVSVWARDGFLEIFPNFRVEIQIYCLIVGKPLFAVFHTKTNEEQRNRTTPAKYSQPPTHDATNKYKPLTLTLTPQRQLSLYRKH